MHQKVVASKTEKNKSMDTIEAKAESNSMHV